MELAMAHVCLLLVSGFLVVNLTSYGHAFSKSNDQRDEDFDWKSAIKKINELERMVRVQNERISNLEKRSESERTSIVELQETVQKEDERIRQLEENISELSEGKAKDDKIKPIHNEQVSVSKQTTFTQNRNFVRKERLLVQPTTLPTQGAAFFAYYSSHTILSSPHQILIFDTVITNAGNAYHAYMGTFIAPRSGMYAFIWTVRMDGFNDHTTELLHENKVINSIYLHPGNAMQRTVTGTAVVNVSQGDDVFIRTGTISNGRILSDANGRSSFAGWLLM